MRATLEQALAATTTAVGADAAIVRHRSVTGTGWVLVSSPAGLVPEGTPWPDGPAGNGQVSTDVASWLPDRVRDAVGQAIRAVAVLDLPDDTTVALLWWSAPPTVESVADRVEPQLAKHAGDWYRERTAQLNAALLSSVLESADHGVAAVDALREIAQVNPSAARLLRMQPGEWPVHVLDAAVTALAERTRNRGESARVLDAVQASADARVIGSIWRFDDSPAYVSVSTWPVRSPQIAGRIWVLDDVTPMGVLQDEVRAAREAQAEADERFARAMQAAPVGMCLVGPDGTLLSVNDAMCVMLGRSERELVTMSWREVTHPDDLGSDEALVGEILAGQRDGYRLDKRYVRSDGLVVWADLSVSCVRGDDDKVRYFISQIRDVTDEHVSRQMLRESEERFRLLAENSTDVTFHYDSGGHVDWVSPSLTAVTGYQPEDMLGTRQNGLVHPDDVPGIEEMRAQLAAGGVGRLEARFKMADGSYRWMSVVSRDQLVDGRVVARATGWRDIDAEMKARLMLTESMGAMRAMADGMLDPQLLMSAVRDENGTIIDFRYVISNRAANLALGHGGDHLEGLTLTQTLPGIKASGLFERYVDVVETGHPLALEDFAYDGEPIGTGRRFDLRGQRVGDGLSLSWRDVTRRFEQLADLDQRARYDKLTGLVGRAELLDQLSVLLTRREASEGQLALLFCDVDFFKPVNDTYGHAAGDEVLRVVADRVRASVREGDVAGRLGGDELLVVLRGIRARDDALAVAEKIRDSGSAPIEWQGEPLTVTLTVGLVLARRGEDVAGLVARADAAMYRGKAAGRNRVVLLDE